jgi:hypothetical protein
MTVTVDPKLVFMIDEAVKSMENHEGYRCSFYLRAASDYIHSIQSNKVEIALEDYEDFVDKEICKSVTGVKYTVDVIKE